MARAAIIDIKDILTDESENHRNDIALVRQIVAAAGVRVSEQALREAVNFARDSFAPDHFDAMIFKLVNRDTTLGLRCISAFKKNRKPVVRLRKEAAQIVQACKLKGWKLALSESPTEDVAGALQRAKLLQQFDVKDAPRQMKIKLPDPRALEFLVGALGAPTGETVLIGTRIDNNIRSGNMLRMTTVHLQMGHHGKNQMPRDLKDMPDYEAPSVEALLNVIPTVV